MRSDIADAEEESLSVEVLRHLGRLLACAYDGVINELSASERFAHLVARLEATLDEASRRDTAKFQPGLLATAPALRRYDISRTRDPATADDLV